MYRFIVVCCIVFSALCARAQLAPGTVDADGNLFLVDDAAHDGRIRLTPGQPSALVGAWEFPGYVATTDQVAAVEALIPDVSSFATTDQLPALGSVSNWNVAYGWGNHADAGYMATIPDRSIAAVKLATQNLHTVYGGWGDGTHNLSFGPAFVHPFGPEHGALYMSFYWNTAELFLFSGPQSYSPAAPRIFHSLDMGAGSGLDADTLRGLAPSDFATTAQLTNYLTPEQLEDRLLELDDAGTNSVVFGYSAVAGELKSVYVTLATNSVVLVTLAENIGYLAQLEVVAVRTNGFDYVIRTSGGLVTNAWRVAWLATDSPLAAGVAPYPEPQPEAGDIDLGWHSILGESGSLKFEANDVRLVNTDLASPGVIAGPWEFDTRPDIPGYITSDQLANYLTVSAGDTHYARRTTTPAGPTSSGTNNQWSISGTNLYFYNNTRWVRFIGTTNFTGGIPTSYPVPTTPFTAYVATNTICKVTDGHALIKYYTNDLSGVRHIIEKITRPISMNDEIVTTNNYAVTGLVHSNVVSDGFSADFLIHQVTYYGDSIAEAYENIDDESFTPIAEAGPSNTIRNVELKGVITFYAEFAYPTGMVFFVPKGALSTPSSEVAEARGLGESSNVVSYARVDGNILPVVYYAITNASTSGTWAAISAIQTTSGVATVAALNWSRTSYSGQRSPNWIAAAVGTFQDAMVAWVTSDWQGPLGHAHGIMVPALTDVFRYDRDGPVEDWSGITPETTLVVPFRTGTVHPPITSAPLMWEQHQREIDTPDGTIYVFATGHSSNIIDNVTSAVSGDIGGQMPGGPGFADAWNLAFISEANYAGYPGGKSAALAWGNGGARLTYLRDRGAGGGSLGHRYVNTFGDNNPLRVRFQGTGLSAGDYNVVVFYWNMPENIAFSNAYEYVARGEFDSYIMTLYPAFSVSALQFYRTFASLLRNPGDTFQWAATGGYLP